MKESLEKLRKKGKKSKTSKINSREARTVAAHLDPEAILAVALVAARTFAANNAAVSVEALDAMEAWIGRCASVCLGRDFAGRAVLDERLHILYLGILIGQLLLEARHHLLQLVEAALDCRESRF